MTRTRLLVSVLAVAASACFATTASAAITSQTITGTATPSTQSQTTFGPVADLNVVGATTYDGIFAPRPTNATLHFDNDFQFDASGVPECNEDLSAADSNEADALCGDASIGFGTITTGSSFPDIISNVRVYNTAPSGGDPTAIIHIYTAADDSTFVDVASIVDSSAGGDFGKQVALDLPAPPSGFAPREVDLSLHTIVSARCNDVNTLWDYRADYVYDGPPGSQTVTDTQACTVAPKHTLTVSTSGTGTGSVTSAPTGIDCPGDCTEDYDEDTGVTLTPDAASGSTFTGWSGACTGTGACNVTMDADKSVTAQFSPSTGATLSGVITKPASAGGGPIANARVGVCGPNGCFSDQTDGSGTYSISGLPADFYWVSAGPPPTGPQYRYAGDEIEISGPGMFTQNLQLGDAPTPPPGNVTVGNKTGVGGIPVVYVNKPFLISVTGAVGCTASYSISLDGTTISSGALTEGPAGTYARTVTLTSGGQGNVTITVDCPGTDNDQNAAFNIYIDPSGVIANANTGDPIEGATATLFREDIEAGAFDTPVPDGSDIMSPSNRSNPDTTGADGRFAWDTVPGFYKVKATKAGCLPGETAVLPVPPEQLDLLIELICTPPVPTVLSTTPATGSNDNNPKIKGTAEPNSTVTLYTNDDCTSPVAATGPVATFAGDGLPVNVADNSTTTFFATAENDAGTSPCSPSSVTYTETTPATTPPPPAATTTAPTGQRAAALKKCKKKKTKKAKAKCRKKAKQLPE